MKRTPNGRSRNRVRCHGLSGITVDVDIDPRVVSTPSTRDRSEVGGRREGGTTTRDDKVGTFGVELGGVGLVESKKLKSNEICARLESNRDSSSPFKSIHDFSIAPRSIVDCTAKETSLVDFEPLQSTNYISQQVVDDSSRG